MNHNVSNQKTHPGLAMIADQEAAATIGGYGHFKADDVICVRPIPAPPICLNPIPVPLPVATDSLVHSSTQFNATFE